MRAKHDLETQTVSDLMRVARSYGDREDIAARLSWTALLTLSGLTLSAAAHRDLEGRILAGERIGATQILEAAKGKPPSRTQPPD